MISTRRDFIKGCLGVGAAVAIPIDVVYSKEKIPTTATMALNDALLNTPLKKVFFSKRTHYKTRCDLAMKGYTDGIHNYK